MTIGTPSAMQTKGSQIGTFASGASTGTFLTAGASIGALVCVLIYVNAPPDQFSAFTDSAGNTWKVQQNGSNTGAAVAWSILTTAITTSTTFTATLTGGKSYWVLDTFSVSGIIASPLDTSNAHNYVTVTNLSSPALSTGTLASAVEIIIGFGVGSTLSSYTEDAAFTTYDDNNSFGAFSAYKIVTNSTNSVSWNPTFSSCSPEVVLVSFEGAIVLTATAFSDSSPTLGTPAAAIITPLVLGNFSGNGTSSGPVLDFGLNRLHANANAMYICSTVPTTYVQATTTFALGNVTPGAGTLFGTMSNGSPAGRIVNSVAITTGAVTVTGTPVGWAVVDTVNADLLMTGTASGFSAVTSGQTWQLGSFDVHMSNT